MSESLIPASPDPEGARRRGSGAVPTPAGLQNRLMDFGAATCRELRRLPKDLVGRHLAVQLVRAATSPAANYAEARAAESRRDFIDKMQICLKELREAEVWLGLARRLQHRETLPEALQKECRELIAIFVASVNTARRGTDQITK